MKVFLLLSFLVLQQGAQAQELLANGNFEDANICTEYIKNCAPEAWFSTMLVNNYYFEGKQAYAGTHFCGVIVGNIYAGKNWFHSFLVSRLLCGLRKDNRYRVSFYAWSKHPAFDSLGVYFSTANFLYDNRPVKQVTPSQLVRDSEGALASPQQWRPISFVYTATGQEHYLVLGSWKRQEFRFSAEADKDNNFLLFIDSVSMVPLDPHELICKGADSMKAVIYDDNDRHNLLEKRRSIYRHEPPSEKAPPSTIVQHIDTLLIPDILFATGSAKLNESSHHLLDSFSVAIMSRVFDSLVIEGHTDSIGSLQYNSRLSANRANAVEQYLRLRDAGGLPRVVVRYHAFFRPIASNATPEGRTRNRRVELFLYRHN